MQKKNQAEPGSCQSYDEILAINNAITIKTKPSTTVKRFMAASKPRAFLRLPTEVSELVRLLGLFFDGCTITTNINRIAMTIIAVSKISYNTSPHLINKIIQSIFYHNLV